LQVQSAQDWGVTLPKKNAGWGNHCGSDFGWNPYLDSQKKITVFSAPRRRRVKEREEENEAKGKEGAEYLRAFTE
jgi:hypothetical protein